jgi:hypothetical protein
VDQVIDRRRSALPALIGDCNSMSKQEEYFVEILKQWYQKAYVDYLTKYAPWPPSWLGWK